MRLAVTAENPFAGRGGRLGSGHEPPRGIRRTAAKAAGRDAKRIRRVYFEGRGQTLPRTPGTLAAIDNLIDGADDKDSLARLARPIGMFYGDILTHTIPGAHWEVVERGYPGFVSPVPSLLTSFESRLGDLLSPTPPSNKTMRMFWE